MSDHDETEVPNNVLALVPVSGKSSANSNKSAGPKNDTRTPVNVEVLDEEQRDDGDSRFLRRPEGMFFLKPVKGGVVEVQLTNFVAEIIEDVIIDDGVDTRREFVVRVTLGKQVRLVRIKADEFPNVGQWVMRAFGPEPVVFPGSSIGDYTRAAVQLLSGKVPERLVVGHTGMRMVDGERVYFHAGGAIGKDGVVVGIDGAELPRALSPAVLPEPPVGAELRKAVVATLSLLTLAPLRIMGPLIAATFLAPLAIPDFVLWLTGITGSFKTEVAALIQRHFGTGFDARTLPGNWESTANFLEELSFIAAGMVLVIDDFAPGGQAGDMKALHTKGARVIRNAGNGAFRGRMNGDLSLRAGHPPRALILSTGEDVLRGHSLRARMLILEVGQSDVDVAKLTQAQVVAAQGLFAATMAGYVRWVTGLEDLEAELRRRVAEARSAATGSVSHRRTPEIVANLAAGFGMFVRFAVDEKVLSLEEGKAFYERVWRGIGEAASAQGAQQAAADPVRRFREFVRAAVASGEAHLANPGGREPDYATGFGWQCETVGSGDKARDVWRARGKRIGWVDDKGEVYLDPESSFGAAQRMAQQAQVDLLPVSGATFHKRLHEAGVLASIDTKRETLMVRRTFEARRRDVLHVVRDFLGELREAGRPLSDESPEEHADNEKE